MNGQRNLYEIIPGAPNFKYYEFTRSETALRHNLNNVPNEEYIWANIENLAANVLQPIRNKFGRIRILSGYRSPDVNIKIGGSKTSNHCRGEAADIEPIEKGVSLLDIMNFIHDNLEWRWMIAEYMPWGWIHIDYRNSGNIKGIKLKDKNHHYANVNMEFLNKINTYV